MQINQPHFFQRSYLQKTLLSMVLLASLTGCAEMTTRQKSAAVGAAVGGVAGAVLTNGSAFGTVGGAAIGGVIGHGIDNLKGK